MGGSKIQKLCGCGRLTSVKERDKLTNEPRYRARCGSCRYQAYKMRKDHCEHCGTAGTKTNTLQVDHIDNNPSNNNNENLQTLCFKCHIIKTRNSKDWEKGIINRENQRMQQMQTI